MNELDKEAELGLCGYFVAHLISGSSWYPCALLKDHEGGHRASGNCFIHGYYLGEVDQPPRCPKWPDCATSSTFDPIPSGGASDQSR